MENPSAFLRPENDYILVLVLKHSFLLCYQLYIPKKEIRIELHMTLELGHDMHPSIPIPSKGTRRDKHKQNSIVFCFILQIIKSYWLYIT